MRFSNIKLKRLRPILGTYVSIELSGSVSRATLNHWISAGFEAILEVDRVMSRFRPESDISRLNHACPGEWVEIHPLTGRVLRAANQLFKSSQGAFDIRCLAPAVPTQLDSGRNKLPVEIRGRLARKFGSWEIDLGGIAKGFAVDHACDRIQKISRGYAINGCINAGGDLRVWGRDRRTIAIDEGSGIRTVHVRKTALATSSIRTGDTRLSPATHLRMPSRTPVTQARSTTVFAACCLWADALTKIVLTAPRTASRCISSYNARAVIYPTSTSPGQLIG